MIVVVTILHILVSLILIGVVLLQTGKRADLAGAFGGGGSQTAFGPRGAANILSRITTWAAVLFMLTSLSLAILSARASGSSASVLDGVGAETEVTEPAPAEDGDGEAGAPATLGVDDDEAGAPATLPTPDESSDEGADSDSDQND